MPPLTTRPKAAIPVWLIVTGALVAALVVAGVIGVAIGGDKSATTSDTKAAIVPAAPADKASDAAAAQAKLQELQAKFAGLDRQADLVGAGACPLIDAGSEWGGEVRGAIYCTLARHSEVVIGLASGFGWTDNDSIVADISGNLVPGSAVTISTAAGGQLETRCENTKDETGFTIAPVEISCVAIWRLDDLVVVLRGTGGTSAADVKATLADALAGILTGAASTDLSALQPT